MSLFHDDPFDVISEGAPAEQEGGEEEQSAGESHNQEAQEEDALHRDAPQDEQDATNEVLGDDEEATLADVAAESDIERPRKRSRPQSPVDGEDQRDASEQEANGAVQLPEETEPAVAVVGPSEVFVEQQRQLSLSELVAKSTQLELQLQASRAQRETLQQLLSNTKDQLERRVAELGAEASAVAKSGDEILKSVTAQHTSSIESMMAAATEARLSLSAAERGFREQKYWQHRSEFLEDALSWQQRSAGLWRDAFECAQKKTSHHTDATKLMSSTHQDVELLRSALAPSNAIVQSITSAQGWLDSLATTGDDEGAATIRLPLEKRALLHKLLQMTAEHVSDIATDHDALAAALGKSYQQIDQLKRTLSVSGLADLEPRIALLREMVDRQHSGTYVAPEETELRLKLKSLQDRNSLLEAVVASHIAKVDLIPNATSVVPHVLKDRIARCEVLEKEITDLRCEVAYLQRLRGTEGAVDLPLQQGDGTPSQRTGKDTLLEVCAQQWLERARSATQLLLASCDPSEDRRSLALTTLQLLHALAAGQHQSVMLEHLRNTNALLHSQLASCQHLCEVLFAVPAVTTVTGEDASEWISCVEQAMSQMKECIASVGASHTLDDLTTACATINATMDATLTKHGASLQASLIEGQDRYRKAMGFLISALNHADAALCASAGVEHRPIAEVPLDAFEMQPAVLTVRSVVAPAAANTADVKRVLAAQVDANKAAIASLTASLRSQISFHEKRWEWVVSQEGNHAVKELALAQDAVRSTTSLLAASNERCEEALKGAANAAQLQKRLSEKEERVTSLESQFKISQDALSKSRQELAALNKERTAASASADAAIATLNRTVEKLEADLVEARQALIAAQEESNNVWANEDDAPAVEADNEEFQEVHHQVVEAPENDEVAGPVDNMTLEAEDLQTTQENGYDESEANHNDDGDGDAALDDNEVVPDNDAAEEEEDTQLESEATIQTTDDAEASGVTSTDE
ncbi:kinesin-like protein, putative [Bodo saltans]|uniref:Kinesin-like protein, putative n=1 Tax=Bodo saltans TaxID=75058 RepID=A0A0S4IPN1_BODSA|nr:kinesin-like protein, putative [Bodo saltans]|eukprot:CUF08651.1 kinesin-like protein, putative [Bodo saltans]